MQSAAQAVEDGLRVDEVRDVFRGGNRAPLNIPPRHEFKRKLTQKQAAQSNI
jgi:hypothetical protein